MGDRRARLVDDGWVFCPKDGSVELLVGDAPAGPLVVERCPDCFEGLLPPDGMVEAGSEAVRHVMLFGRKDIRAVLVEAERWAAKQ